MCELCHGKDGCRIRPGRYLGDCEELTVEDWDMVYQFMRHIWLPFIHSVILRARKRQKGAVNKLLDDTKWLKGGSNGSVQD